MAGSDLAGIPRPKAERGCEYVRAQPAGGQARSWPTSVGNVALPGCIMPASGTYGFGDEIAGYVDPRTLGAIVTKSLAAFEHGGNPAPRVAPTPAGMLNSVGLQGPGIAYWAERYLPSVQQLGVLAHRVYLGSFGG